MTAQSGAVERGYSITSTEEKTHFFFYDTTRKQTEIDPKDFSAFRQLEANDDMTLVMQTHQSNHHKHLRSEFDFFKATHQIQTVPAYQSKIFAVALDAKGVLKSALIKDAQELLFPHYYPQFEIKRVLKLFTHIDGSYSLAAQIVNDQSKLSYFDRGNAQNNCVIIKLSPLLHYVSHHKIGDVEPEAIIDMVKDRLDNYYLLTQTTPQSFAIYTHNFKNNRTQKQGFTTKEPLTLSTFSSRDYVHFLIGADKGTWLEIRTDDLSLRSHKLFEKPTATVKSIDRLYDNGYIISGTLLNKEGNYDMFIQSYSASKSFVWGRTYASNLNEQTDKHALLNKKVILSGWGYDPKHTPLLTAFNIDYQGKVVRVASIKSMKEQFIEALSKKMSKKLKEAITLHPDGTISFKHRYRAAQHSLTAAEASVVKAFFDTLRPLLCSKPYRNSLEAINLYGLTSSEWRGKDRTTAYLQNSQLGYQRAYSLLELFLDTKLSHEDRSFLHKHLQTTSLSSAKTVKQGENLENFEESRRNLLKIFWKPSK